MFSTVKAGAAKLSEAEQRQLALDTLMDAWNTAIKKGVDADVLAKTAIFAGLSDIVGAYGERAIADMTRELPDRSRQGDFTVRPTARRRTPA
jgi:hypothetical protein